MRHNANNLDTFRFRTERSAGARGLGRVLDTRAPRLSTSGQSDAQTSGGSGGGIQFGGGITIEVPEIGNPVTGARIAMWGFFAWDSTVDYFGA